MTVWPQPDGGENRVDRVRAKVRAERTSTADDLALGRASADLDVTAAITAERSVDDSLGDLAAVIAFAAVVELRDCARRKLSTPTAVAVDLMMGSTGGGRHWFGDADRLDVATLRAVTSGKSSISSPPAEGERRQLKLEVSPTLECFSSPLPPGFSMLLTIGAPRRELCLVTDGDGIERIAPRTKATVSAVYKLSEVDHEDVGDLFGSLRRAVAVRSVSFGEV